MPLHAPFLSLSSPFPAPLFPSTLEVQIRLTSNLR